MMGALLLAPGCGSTIARTDAHLFPRPPRDALTFWGHACCYFDVGGYGILTDPVFETRLFMRRRKVPAPPTAAYADVRVILVSHAHDDHLSPKTIATFPESTLVVCPEPAAAYLQGVRQRVRTMRPGDVFEFPGGRIVAVAADHPGGRHSRGGAADGRALGYVVFTPQLTLYYSGDTEFFPGFAAVARTYHPNLAILNIQGHLHSMDAVRAARALEVDTVVPVHHAAYGYYFWGQRKQPRDYEELQRELRAILLPLGLGESLPLACPMLPAPTAPSP